MNHKVTVSLPIINILLIVFIVLKLCKVITWSWLWVLSPLWIPAAFILLVVIVLFIVSAYTGL